MNDYDDDEERPRGRPRQLKPVEPCARCGALGGTASYTGRPRRMKGQPFGVDGVLCQSCYYTLQRRPARQRRQISREAVGLARLVLAYCKTFNSNADIMAVMGAYDDMKERAKAIVSVEEGQQQAAVATATAGRA